MSEQTRQPDRSCKADLQVVLTTSYLTDVSPSGSRVHIIRIVGAQENLFKYPRQEYLIDALVDYQVKPDDPPVWFLIRHEKPWTNNYALLVPFHQTARALWGHGSRLCRPRHAPSEFRENGKETPP